MDISDVLRTIAELSSRAARAGRDRQRRNYDHRSTREALKQTTADLEEVAKLADILYETSHRMGTVIDYLLKERGVDGQESDSFEMMLSHVLNGLEEQGEEGRPRLGGDSGQQRPQMAQATESGPGPREVA
ncbi:uncharacterized protein LDX57_007841 [Aspergillus melleus]|uniref:uncharacterized protein n=1 Tax=Aspergillus melleus TaxID=138277 RepID=UPI001E8E9771|nr:uncharacterized protein LDX57_007799 [Aspergillus melleus]XP_045945529.1 uncharacterized protein LDX57_007841 [Aspergillus melleus]KAH8430129.1 hypothetical protein LDX57_007799 [Aspergillus melleus]KAH8430171.1 hypothetical protein LDX57_007841 [Aspergillus melleus]